MGCRREEGQRATGLIDALAVALWDRPPAGLDAAFQHANVSAPVQGRPFSNY